MGKDGRLFNLEGTGWAVKSVKYTMGDIQLLEIVFKIGFKACMYSSQRLYSKQDYIYIVSYSHQAFIQSPLQQNIPRARSPLCIYALHTPSSNFHVQSCLHIAVWFQCAKAYYQNKNQELQLLHREDLSSLHSTSYYVCIIL